MVTVQNYESRFIFWNVSSFAKSVAQYQNASKEKEIEKETLEIYSYQFFSHVPRLTTKRFCKKNVYYYHELRTHLLLICILSHAPTSIDW